MIEQTLDVVKETGNDDKKPLSTDANKGNSFSCFKVKETRLVDIRVSTDKETPWITGCTFMPDGRVLLCDCNNNKIKVLADNLATVQGSLDLKESPWDISVVNDKMTIITLPYKQRLQYVEVVPSLRDVCLKNGRVIQLGMCCWGVDVIGDYIYVTCQNIGLHGNEGEMRILDLDGNSKRRIENNGSFWATKPYHICVSVRSKRI